MSSRVLARIAGTPWAIQAEALETILDIASRAPVDEASLNEWKGRMAPSRDALDARPSAPMAGAARARIRDGVAVVPVSGPIFRYANMMTDFSGATSLATFASDLTLAADDSKVKAILLEIDSPGGEVTGMAEAAALVRAVSERKPVVAYTEGMAASAAYQIAAAAREIVVAPTAMLGSLGVVLGTTDRRAADAKSGVRRYEIVSSQTPGKRPDVATDDGRARYQAIADRLADEYLSDVAASRGMSVAGLLEATNGGDMVIGVDAVAAGVADRVGTFEDTIARLASGNVPGRRARGLIPQSNPAPSAVAELTEKVMSMAESTPDPIVETPQAEVPGPLATSPTIVVADAGQTERARALAIISAAGPDAHALAVTAIETGMSLEQFQKIKASNAADVERAAARGRVEAFRGSLPAPVAAGETPEAVPLDPEEKAKADWAGSPSLRAEFGDNQAAFLSFRKAERSGKVRILARARG